MLVSPNGSAAKKDLHVGGVGGSPATVLASVIDPLMNASEDWLKKARNAVSTADDYVRNNPWQALGMMAILGVTLGYMLSRRSSSDPS